MLITVLISSSTFAVANGRLRSWGTTAGVDDLPRLLACGGVSDGAFAGARSGRGSDERLTGGTEDAEGAETEEELGGADSSLVALSSSRSIPIFFHNDFRSLGPSLP